MQIALGIGTLLLGGWVLTSPTDNQQSDAISTPPPVQSEVFTYPSGSMKDTNAEGTRGLSHTNKPRRDNDQDDNRTVEEKIKARAGAKQKGPNSYKPMAPTDSSEGGPLGMPLPPTQASEDGSPYGEQPNGESKLPVPPTYRPSSFRPPTSGKNFLNVTRSQLEDRLRDQMNGNPSYQAQTSEKAFANQRMFTSGVSPYMNLFRNDTNGGTIDNYSTYVRPAFEQQSVNQKLGMDVYGLERNARIQNANLQRLDSRTRAPQNVVTPQFIQGGGNMPYSLGNDNGYVNGQ